LRKFYLEEQEKAENKRRQEQRANNEMLKQMVGFILKLIIEQDKFVPF
jgi:hypothetical protein